MSSDARLVWSIANQVMRGKPACVDIEDLVQEGHVALLEAKRHFDERHGVKLWTFAQHRIRGAMLDLLRRDGQRMRKRYIRKIERAQRSGSQRLGREMTSEELSDEMGVTHSQLDVMRRRVHDAEPPIPTPFDEVAEREAADAIQRAMDQLTQRQREDVMRYYGQEETMLEIAGELGLTESSISLSLSRARDRLRAKLAAVAP